jgi:transketolase N-terminal domain/subunit
MTGAAFHAIYAIYADVLFWPCQHYVNTRPELGLNPSVQNGKTKTFHEVAGSLGEAIGSAAGLRQDKATCGRTDHSLISIQSAINVPLIHGCTLFRRG